MLKLLCYHCNITNETHDLIVELKYFVYGSDDSLQEFVAAIGKRKPLTQCVV